MRKAEFEVPTEVMSEFAEKLIQHGVSNSITGTTAEDEIIIEVLYEKDEAAAVDDLEEYLEYLIDSIEEEDEEEDQD